MTKVVFITGGGIGIGREDALVFARAGYEVAITFYEHEAEAKEVVERCIEAGSPKAMAIPLNVMDTESIRAAVKKIVDEFGGINILLNNAGVVKNGSLSIQSHEDIKTQVRTNLEGLMSVSREALPLVKDMIINVASGAGLDAFSNLAPYISTKWGVRGFTKSLALELEIPVYVVNPGETATRMTDFKGDDPADVAQIIFNLAEGKYRLKSGSDVNIWEYL